MVERSLKPKLRPDNLKLPSSVEGVKISKRPQTPASIKRRQDTIQQMGDLEFEADMAHIVVLLELPCRSRFSWHNFS